MKNPLLTQIGQALRDERESQGETVEATATKAKMSKGDLSEIETGGRNFTINTLWRILRALKCNFTFSIGKHGLPKEGK